jgi:hypothetical protein
MINNFFLLMLGVTGMCFTDNSFKKEQGQTDPAENRY